MVQRVVPGPGEGLAVKKTMDSFEVEAAWRRRPTCGSRGCGSGASASKIWPAACAVSVARRARSMLGMGLDCPRVKPRGIAAAAGESGLGAPSGDAGLGRFNLHSVEIDMERKARGKPLWWSGPTHHPS